MKFFHVQAEYIDTMLLIQFQVTKFFKNGYTSEMMAKVFLPGTKAHRGGGGGGTLADDRPHSTTHIQCRALSTSCYYYYYYYYYYY